MGASNFNNASVLHAFTAHKDLQIYQTLQTNIQLTSWTVFTWMLEMVREKTPSLVLRKLSALMMSAGVVMTLLVTEFEELTSRFYPF